MKPAAHAAVLPLLLAASALAADAGATLSKDDPFRSAARPASAAAATPENIEFWGVTTLGSRTELIFKNKSAKRSSWIAKGETKDGIAVLNYDAAREQAVVKIDGAEKVLSLRKATTVASGVAAVPPMPTGFNVPSPAPGGSAALPPLPPVPVTAPAVPAGPPVPQTEVQKQETEARMLVSDLLEIGMAQRKAYEEAQRKAAEAPKPQ